MTTYSNPNAELLHWEYVSAVALVEVLALAMEKDLPALTWHVAGARGLVGEVPPGYGRYDELAEWRRWVEALELTVATPLTVGTTQHVRAVRHYRIRNGKGSKTTINVRATVELPQPSEMEMSA